MVTTPRKPDKAASRNSSGQTLDHTTQCTLANSVARQIRNEGFAVLPGSALGGALPLDAASPDWTEFANSWNHLCLDTYMGDGGRYRQRRYASFRAINDQPIRSNEYQPHHQELLHNPLNGGVDRWFTPMQKDIIEAPLWTALLQFARLTFELCDPSTAKWFIEAHQFRITAHPDQRGLPTPEGQHRDGVDYVFMMLIRRQNIAGGATTLTRGNGDKFFEFNLLQPGDSIFLDDARLLHSVSAVSVAECGLPAFRDMLVVTFTRMQPTAFRSETLTIRDGSPQNRNDVTNVPSCRRTRC